LSIVFVHAVEKPLPRLLSSVNDSVRMLLPDDGRSFELIRSARVTSMCYIIADDSFYWLDRTYSLLTASLASNATVLQVCVLGSTQPPTVSGIKNE